MVLEGRALETALDVMERVVGFYRSKSTEQAESTWQEPVANYRDDELFESERELLFKQIPLPLALSVEIKAPNSYKAMEVMGVPIVLTRDAEGLVRSFLNICRHRGAQICAPGLGKGRALTCNYHNWSYGMDGAIVGVYGETTFGDFDRETRGLVELPCEERHGLVFVCLTQGKELDLDSWLGGMGEVLEDLKLGELHQFSSRQMPGPNWKVVIEGFLEGYHFAALHKDTVFKTNLGNISAFDSFGPHARIAFGLRPLPDAVDTPRETWNPITNVGPIVWVFPGLSIAGGWRDRMAIAFPMPGRNREESMTEQRIFTRKPAETPHEIEEAEIARDFFYDVTYGEDYLTGYGVQQGVLNLPDGDTQIFGRNEIGVQHIHRSINGIMAANDDGVHKQPRVVR
jgi:nitrite reductase/ring-hydroxylating ferredoxin subunit